MLGPSDGMRSCPGTGFEDRDPSATAAHPSRVPVVFPHEACHTHLGNQYEHKIEVWQGALALCGSLVPSSFDARFGPALAGARIRDYRLIWVGRGSEDIFFGGAKAFAARLDAAKIPHVFRQFPGPRRHAGYPAGTGGVAALALSAVNHVHEVRGFSQSMR